MIHRDLVLAQASIDHGRIYFPPEAVIFFPADSFGDRASTGHKGNPVAIYGAGQKFEADIRISSGKRLSPRCSFSRYFEQERLTAGALLRITRTADRQYQIYCLR